MKTRGPRRTEAAKTRAIARLNNGEKISLIAEDMGVSVSTVRLWVNKSKPKPPAPRLVKQEVLPLNQKPSLNEVLNQLVMLLRT
jgi:transposase